MTVFDVKNNLKQLKEFCETTLDLFEYVERIVNMPNCNDCANTKDCEYRPPWGGDVRINCPLWEGRT